MYISQGVALVQKRCHVDQKFLMGQFQWASISYFQLSKVLSRPSIECNYVGSPMLKHSFDVSFISVIKLVSQQVNSALI